MARLTLATLGAALLLARGAAATTCAEKQAAGEACIVPYTFPADTQMCGYTLPSYWDGPAPVCYTQYGHNQCVARSCGAAAAAAHAAPTAPVDLTRDGFSLRVPCPCARAAALRRLATPTFMPSNSSCSAYTNRGCCSSEIVQGCAAGGRSKP
jgi:hypothetical protein